MTWTDELREEYASERERLISRTVRDLKYVRKAAEPETIGQIYAQDTEGQKVRPSYENAYAPPRQQEMMLGVDENWRLKTNAVQEIITGVEDERRTAFAEEVEQVYFRNRHEVPFDWLLEQDPDDLRLIGEGEMADIIYRQQQMSTDHAAFQREMEGEVDARVDRDLRGRKFRALATGLPGIGALMGVANAVGTQTDSDPAELRAQLEEEVRQEWLDLGVSATAEKTMMQRGVDWILEKGLGGLNEMGARGVDAGVWAMANTSLFGVGGPDSPLSSVYDIMRERHDAETDAALAELDAQFGEPNREMLRQVGHLQAEQAWAQLADENPDEFSTYMMMGGGDEMMAFGLFGADLMEDPTVQEQMGAMVDEDTQAYMDLLEEQDFRPSAQVLEIMGAYGKHIPMRLATAFTLLLTDDDMLQDTVTGEWQNLWEEIEKNEFSPAMALGLDGTLVGMGLDLGAGIAFDPTTWIFGPRAQGMAGRASTADDAVRMARGRIGRRSAEDIVRLSRSNVSGQAEVVRAAEFIDEVGMLDELLEAVGYVDTQLPASPWRRTKAAYRATEVRTSTLTEVLDMTDIERMGGFSEDTIGSLRNNILNNGFEDVVTVVYNPQTGKVAVADGLKRLRAATELELDSLPVTVKVVDDIGAGGVELGKMGDNTMPRPPKKVKGDDPYLQPTKIFSESQVYGQASVGAVQDVIERAMKRGATPPSASRLATASWMTGRVKDILRHTGAVGSWIERYMGPQMTVTSLETHGATAFSRQIETAFRIWGDDSERLNFWVNQLVEARRAERAAGKAHTNNISRVRTMVDEYDALVDLQGGGWDDSARHLRDTVDEPVANPSIIREDARAGRAPNPNWNARERALYDETVAGPSPEEAARLEQQTANRQQLSEQIWIKDRQIQDEYRRADVLLRESRRRNKAADVWRAMQEDYNRQHIATNPAWKGLVDPESGIVPWEHLRRGFDEPTIKGAHEGVRQVFPTKMKDMNPNMNPEDLARKVNTVLDDDMAINLEVSPLDMLIASEVGGAAYTRATQIRTAAALRSGLWAFQRAWTLDKVFKLSTAATVSMDEWMRAIHIGGNRAIAMWMTDKANHTAARAMGVLRHGRPTVRAGQAHLPAAMRRRITRVTEGPSYLKQAERQVYEGIGLGYADITPESSDYVDAAQRWVGGWVQDSGFRAMMKGEDAFREWFLSTDGAHARAAVSVDARSGNASLLKDWQEVYQGYKTMYETVIGGHAKKQGKWGQLDKAFREAVKRADESPGTPVNMDPGSLNLLGAVRGVKKEGAKFGLNRVSNAFFDKFFMDPVNYRRGFINDMITRIERKRLTKLFASQGKRIVPNSDLERVLKLRGVNGSVYDGMLPYMEDVALANDVVPESYINRLVENRAAAEIDNLLFTWDQGSRMGQQGRVIFPFGRPWADMAGFWGREVMTRPHLRGWANNRFTNALADQMSFNPKPAAMTSRLANQDFEVDSIAPGVPLPFGAESADFSPLLFFPTEGDNPFGTLLPGLGYVPLWALDRVLLDQYDPLEEPEEYAQLMNTVSDFIPAARYQRGGTAARLLGGGTAGQGLSLTADFFGYKDGAPYYNITNFLGDVGREINRNREVSAIMANEMDDLLAVDDPEVLDLIIEDMGFEADREASKANAAETATRLVAPANARYDESLDQIYDVWFSASEQFPELEVDDRGRDMSDPAQRRQMADDIRNKFFDLPQWKRDLLVSQDPTLAVNLVGSWTWTQEGVNALGLDAESQYRTSGKFEDLERHQTYIDRGYIRPIEPKTRVYRALGLIQSANESVSKEIYTRSAEFVNEMLWEGRVEPHIRGVLEQIADLPWAKEKGVNDARDLWQRWGSLEGELEQAIAADRGIDPDNPEHEEAWDDLKSSVVIPQDQQAWGMAWPGLDDDEVSQRFRAVRFDEFPEEVREIAMGLDIDLTPGMTGLQLFSEVQTHLTNFSSLAMDTARPAYDVYVGTRTATAAAREEQLRAQIHNPELDLEWRQSIDAFLQEAEGLRRKYDGIDEFPTQEEASGVAESFRNVMMTDSKENRLPWARIWEDVYERSYGPLEWEAPDVPPVTLEDGSQNPNAWKPYIRKIVDGDTIEVSRAPGPTLPFGLGLPEADEGFSRMHSVRLLGVAAREYDEEGGDEDEDRLRTALEQAVRNDEEIWLVRDPDTFGTNTDQYGRELAYLVIGDTPFFFEEDFARNLTPSGGEN